ncbi:MAG: thiol:disulfide interchange protein DsbC [Paraglaciecola sp.]|jgi:thiol:disulfide interchange protein DsbC
MMKLLAAIGVISTSTQIGSSMKSWIKSVALASGLCLVASSVIGAVAADDFAGARAKIESKLGMKVSAIGDAPVPGLLQIVTNKGLFYTSEDGKYFLQARIYNLDEDMRNETELALTDMRVDGLKEFSDSVIEYKAEKEKYVVNVFTDITCGYCRKLHNQMGEYNDLGITVRYLAFPRGGLNSGSYKDMVSVWCADDPQQALTEAKNGESIETKKCATKVAEQYAFGQKIGVSGTPNIILPDGSMIPGYQPPKQMAEALKATL